MIKTTHSLLASTVNALTILAFSAQSSAAALAAPLIAIPLMAATHHRAGRTLQSHPRLMALPC